MIKIKFDPEKMELQIEGHANANRKGKDIVCAAVSCLFYTLGESLFQSEKMLKEPPVFRDDEDEEVKICSCIPKEGYAGNIQMIFWTILIGLEGVAKSYPKFIVMKG